MGIKEENILNIKSVIMFGGAIKTLLDIPVGVYKIPQKFQEKMLVLYVSRAIHVVIEQIEVDAGAWQYVQIFARDQHDGKEYYFTLNLAEPKNTIIYGESFYYWASRIAQAIEDGKIKAKE